MLALPSFNGLPIAGVMISAPEVHKFVVTVHAGFVDVDGRRAPGRGLLWPGGDLDALDVEAE